MFVQVYRSKLSHGDSRGKREMPRMVQELHEKPRVLGQISVTNNVCVITEESRRRIYWGYCERTSSFRMVGADSFNCGNLPGMFGSVNDFDVN